MLLDSSSTVAGDPFESQEEKHTESFEEVCLTLVERGWKIKPKTGTYPLKKEKGPPYLALVDPRGNRKTVCVKDPALWEKLRSAEARLRSPKTKNPESKAKLLENEPIKKEEPTQPVPARQEVQEIAIATPAPLPLPGPEIQPLEKSLDYNPVSNLNGTSSVTQLEVRPSLTDATVICAQKIELPTPLAPISTLPTELQSFLFELGFETLISAMQDSTNKNVEPAELRQLILNNWQDDPRELRSMVRAQREQTLLNLQKKDEYITRLENDLRETEYVLAELKRAMLEL